MWTGDVGGKGGRKCGIQVQGRKARYGVYIFKRRERQASMGWKYMGGRGKAES